MTKFRLATALVTLVAVATGPAEAKQSSCRVTRAAYGALEYHTSYRRAVEVLGCPGRRVTRMTIGKTVRTTYTWRGTGNYGANLTLSFRNGHLNSKSQLGLK